MMRTKDIDHGQIGEAIFGGGGTDADLPRDTFAPTLEAVADLSRRVTSTFRAGWLVRIRRTIALAARVRAAHLPGTWPAPTITTRTELVGELRRLRPRLMASPTYAHVACADPVRLTQLVDALRVIEAYRRAA